MRKASHQAFLISALVVFLTYGASSQDRGRGVPEFFGFYGVEEGRTTAIYDGQGSSTPVKHNVELYSIPRNSRIPFSVPELSSSARFILFYSDSGEMVQALSLYRLPYLRNIIEVPDINQRMYGASPKIVATSNSPLLARISELEFRLLAKPVPNQPQMIELVAAPQLVPGLYVVSYNPRGKEGWLAIFQISSSSVVREPFCLDLSLPGGYGGVFERANSELNQSAPLLSQNRYQKCDASAVVPEPASSNAKSVTKGQPETAAPTSIQTGSCHDYNECVAAGVTAISSNQLDTAVSAFQRASTLDAAKPASWAWLGTTYLSAGRTEEAQTMWDKALQLGGPIVFMVCHEQGFHRCETGNLIIGLDQVSFVKMNRERVFEIPISQVAVKGVFDNSAARHVSFGLRVSDRNYNFDFQPWNVGCQALTFFQCSPEGTTQQLQVANYISHTIPKVASGVFGNDRTSHPSANLGPASFDDFYAAFRRAVAERNRTELRSLMSDRFQWAGDGMVSRDQAVDNIGKIFGWEQFWITAQKAVAANAVLCKHPECGGETGYHAWANARLPLEMLFAQNSNGRWSWTAVLGD